MNNASRNRRRMIESLEKRRLLSAATFNMATIAEYPLLPAPTSRIAPAAGPLVTPGATHPLSSLPSLSSRPSASKTIYLNFTGDNVPNWGSQHPGIIPAYTIDGDATTFTDQEITTLTGIWAEVADKYSPFNINVTTVKPANTGFGQMFQMDIGGTNAWHGGGGGVAAVNGFTDPSLSNIGFDFSTQNPSSVDANAEDCAHETGHGLGLNHQGVVDGSGNVTTEYSNGDGYICPIMGGSNLNPNERGIWFNGASDDRDGNNNVAYTGIQDDLSVISNSTNGFGYRADDYTFANAPTLTSDNTGAIASGFGGVIENVNDDDPFRFIPQGPNASFTISEGVPSGMLAPAAVIENANLSVVTGSVNTNTSCTITATNLTPGQTYYLDVRSQGGYGDLGEYSISGSGSTFAYLTGSALHIVGYGNNANALTVALTNSGASYTLTDTASGGGTTSLVFPAASVASILVNLGSGNDSVDFGGGSLAGMAPATISGGGGTDSVVVDDSAATTSATYSVVVSGGYQFAGRSGVYQSAADSSVESETLLTSAAAGDDVTVFNTMIPTTVTGKATGTVNVGNGNAYQVNAAVRVTNPASFTTLTIDDQFDSGGHPGVYLGAGTLTGLAPAAITWATTDVNGVTINGGSGGNAFYCTGASTFFSTTVNLGSGNDAFELDNNASGLFVVNGQAGTDTATVVDQSTAAIAYTFTSAGLTRSGLSISVGSTTDRLILDTGAAANTIQMDALPPTAVVVNGSTVGNTYNVGTTSHLLPSFAYGVTISQATGGGVLLLDNAAYNAPTSAVITASTFTNSTGTLTYSNLNKLTDNTSVAAATVTITSTALSTAYIINGNNGKDTLNIGGGDLTNLVSLPLFAIGGVTFNPGSSSGDSLILDDSVGTVGRTYALSANNLVLPSRFTVAYTGYPTVTLNAGTGNDTINISGQALLSPLTVNAGDGDDNVTVSPLSGLQGNVTVNGQGGYNTLTIANPGSANFRVYPTYVGIPFGSGVSYPVYYATIQSLVLNLGSLSTTGNTVDVNGTAPGTSVTVNSLGTGNTIDVNQTDPTGPVVLTPAAGSDPVNVDAPGIGLGAATVQFGASQQIGLLTLGPLGLAVVTSGVKKVLQLPAIVATGAGTLDANGNDLDFSNSTLSAITAFVRTGLDLGSAIWQGPGIDSTAAANDVRNTAALAVVQNNQAGTPFFSSSKTFDGVVPYASDILVKSTYYGDANLDGKVDGSDYSLIDNAFGKAKSGTTLTGWYNGDLNYDGIVDGSDYSLIDNAFNNQGGAIPSNLIAQTAVTVSSVVSHSHSDSHSVSMTAETTTAIPIAVFVNPGVTDGFVDWLNESLSSNSRRRRTRPESKFLSLGRNLCGAFPHARALRDDSKDRDAEHRPSVI